MTTKTLTTSDLDRMVRMIAGSSEWEEARLGRITASVAAACLGESPWMSPQEAYRVVRGEGRPQNNWYMEHGKEMEPAAVLSYEMRTGRICQKTGFWVHPEHHWLGASPDRLVGRDGLLEIKTGKSWHEGWWQKYQAQCQVQLACTGRQWCDIAFFQGGEIQEIVRILPDYAITIERLKWFYETFMIAQKKPARGEVQKKWQLRLLANP